MRKSRVFLGSLVVMAALSSTACTFAEFRQWTRESKFLPEDVFEQPVGQVDVLALISYGNLKSSDYKGADYVRAFDQALMTYPVHNEQVRNQIQDRIIMASNEMCERYKVVLARKHSNVGFGLGLTSIALSGAGAVTQSYEGAKYLASLAAFSSGARAQYNENYFSDLAAQIVTKGITARRAEILAQIADSRMHLGNNYTLERAIADAVNYHGACTLIGGLEKADVAVSREADKAIKGGKTGAESDLQTLLKLLPPGVGIGLVAVPTTKLTQTATGAITPTTAATTPYPGSGPDPAPGHVSLPALPVVVPTLAPRLP